MDYIEKVTGMKATKSCLCRKTVTVATKWQQSNFKLLKYHSIVKQLRFNGILKFLLHWI